LRRSTVVALERQTRAAYSLPMNDTPHHTQPADWDPPMPSEAEMLAVLARSEAELAAGLTVSAETVHRRIRDAIARIEAKKHAQQAADLG